ncbi:MAG: hypothetical protein IJZ32_00470 [Clostridia bacterium]|nr:hypothetical protein [Clostridia bacterium]
MTEEMEVISEENKEKKWSFGTISCLVWFVAQAGFCVAYLLGGFSGMNDDISALTVVFRVLDFFSCSTTLWYYYLSSLAQAFLYVAVMVAIVKSLFRSFKYFKNKAEPNRNGFLRDEFFQTFYYCILYVLLSNTLYEARLSSGGIALMVIGLLVVAGGRVLNLLATEKKYTWQYLTATAGYMVVKGIILGALGAFIAKDVVGGLLDGIVAVFTTVNWKAGAYTLYSIYQVLGVYVIHTVLLVQLVRILSDELCSAGSEENNHWVSQYMAGKYLWVHLFKTACVYLAIDAALFLATSYGAGEMNIMAMLSGYFEIGRTTVLPIFLLVVAGRTTFRFPGFPKYKKETVETISVPEIQEKAETEEEPNEAITLE